MKKWLKENWFKLGILVVVFIAVILFFGENHGNQNSQITTAGNANTQSSLSIASTTGNENPNDINSSTPQSIQIPPAASSEISAADMDPLLDGIVEIYCGAPGGFIQGSGSLWKIDGNYVVLTNEHVIASTYADGSCVAFLPVTFQGTKTTTPVKIYPANAQTWNSETDAATLDLVLTLPPNSPFENLITNQDYGISALEKCPPNMPMDAPVAVIGFPAFTQQATQPDAQGDVYTLAARTITNGVISAYDTSDQSQGYNTFNGRVNVGSLPYPNYFVSNVIDHGSSGGIAISKNNGNLCVLGIPTWLNQGVSAIQGVVQDINNIMWVGN
jgi:hypothetical protein